MKVIGNANKKPISRFVKIGIFFVIILAPVLVVMLVFGPMASLKARKEMVQKYGLPQDFKREDFDRVVEHIKQDKEFAFYFYALQPSDQLSAANQAFEILRMYRQQDGLLEKIKEAQREVLAKSNLFYYLEFPNGFAKNPEGFSDFNQILWDFLREELKLTILGLCYKATFDPSFYFQWNEEALASADKLRSIVFEMKSWKDN